ncbi:MAG TPA: pyridoxamine 5'-phosphate oxidase family protein, partial [Lachnospiraceae bacterium]|nr:pyridoxamine 5'-phosphate oxidase family protein [Lachnospiraceae bacterium]
MLNYLFAVLFPGKPKEKKKGNLKNHKQIFSFTNNSVFATASADGVPNIVPIHSKHLVPGNKVLISDQFMNKTKHNILQNPYGTLLIRDSGQL